MCSQSSVERPSTWNAQSPSLNANCQLVKVLSGTREYAGVHDRLRATMPQAKIMRLERVQNVLLWEFYQMRKQMLRKTNAGRDPNEVSVWHGTSQHDPKGIYEDRQDGFMTQHSGNGMWGRGLYFAEKASYSNQYAHKLPSASDTGSTRSFLLAKLLVGDEVEVMVRFPFI